MLLTKSALGLDDIDREIDQKFGELESLFAKYLRPDGTLDSARVSDGDLKAMNEGNAALRALIDRREQIAQLMRVANPGGSRAVVPTHVRESFTDVATGRKIVVLRPEQKMHDLHARQGAHPSTLDIGAYVKGIVTGEWVSAELKAMSEGTATAGGHLVPTPLSSFVIDLARAQTVLVQAGAQTIPMDSSTLKIARVDDVPSAVWHVENAADITSNDHVFGAVTLRARALGARMTLSRELIEDAVGLRDVIERETSRQFAEQLDAAGLYGAGTNEPTGIYNTPGRAIVSMGANGAVVTDFDPLLDAIYNVEAANYAPNGYVWHPRTDRDVSKLKATDNQPLQAPAKVGELRRLVTGQIKIDQTQGTATNASDVFVGDFSRVIIGVRTELTIETVKSDNLNTSGQIGLFAWMRADVVVERGEAFSVIQGVIPTP